MTTENTNTTAAAAEKSDRPARRYSGKPAADAKTIPSNPAEFFSAFAKSLPGPYIPQHNGIPAETIVDVTAKLIAWPMEQWLDTLYKGYEVALAMHDAVQGFERKIESIVAGGENTAFQSVQKLTNQSLSSLGKFADSPLQSFWNWPSANQRKKEW